MRTGSCTEVGSTVLYSIPVTLLQKLLTVNSLLLVLVRTVVSKQTQYYEKTLDFMGQRSVTNLPAYVPSTLQYQSVARYFLSVCLLQCYFGKTHLIIP